MRARFWETATSDKALVLILVPLWVFVFALALKTQIEGGGYAVLGLSLADGESYPAITGVYYRFHPTNPRGADRPVRQGRFTTSLMVSSSQAVGASSQSTTRVVTSSGRSVRSASSGITSGSSETAWARPMWKRMPSV